MEEKMQFVHLHMHTEYSILDGAIRIKELVQKVKELGMTSVAITDHGNMYGAINFYKECIKEGIKPILGCEVYVAPRSRFQKEAGIDNKYNHLILLAKNNDGYKNLIKLVSLGFTEGFYTKPRIDKEILERYSDGLICLSACLAGEIPQLILSNNFEEAMETAKEYENIFGKENYYLEMQENQIAEQKAVNQGLIKISRMTGIPLVATNDCHYLNEEDYFVHEVLLCLQTSKTISDSTRMRFPTNEFFVKSTEQMYERFKNFPEAITNTAKIAEKCNVTFNFGKTILPEFKIDEDITHLEYFKRLCQKGIDEKYPDKNREKAIERMNYEIEVIDKMGFIDYFLIVQDFINYAKSNDIPVGPGRGSGAGSICAYLIGITNIDPIEFNLIFERFLNPERVSMPDFDVDFCYERRSEVIDYVSRKYGKNHVAQIVTFGTMAAKAAVRDIARVLDFPYAKGDQIARALPQEHKVTLNDAMKNDEEFRNLYNMDEDVKKVVDLAMKVEGMVRNVSTHAAGVVISKEEVSEYVPLCTSSDVISTQYTMTELEELGLLKMDFLGLRTLTVIKDALDLVEKNYNIKLDLTHDFTDKGVYKLLTQGKTSGIFQLESSGFKQLMQQLKPDKLEDIIVMIALYRPGPMDQIPKYMRNKNSNAEIEYTHKALIPILKDTYGCMVYQEQVMQIFRDLAGYSLGRADIVRRAMSKKKLDVMAREREIFIHGLKDENGKEVIEGALKRGIDLESCNKIFDEMASFAKYAFNKSHAAAYATVSYQTAYLKVHYPAEFFAATMNSLIGNLDKISEYIQECKINNIKVVKPDINISMSKFTAKDNEIVFAMQSIKNVGTKAIEKVVSEREENGEYTDLINFCERVSNDVVNKKCVESLIRAGCFDDLYIGTDINRFDLLANFEKILDTVSVQKKKNFENQMTMFELITKEQNESIKLNIEKVGTVPSKGELLNMEKEVTGIYISGHPLDEFKTRMDKLKLTKSVDLQNLKPDTEVTVCGTLTQIRRLITKKGTQMAFAQIEDVYSTIEIIIFEKQLFAASDILSEGKTLVVKGRISKKEEYVNVVVNSIQEILDIKLDKTIYLKIPKEKDEEKRNLSQRLKEITLEYKGKVPVCIFFEQENKVQKLNSNFFLNASFRCMEELENIFGKENVKIIEK